MSAVDIDKIATEIMHSLEIYQATTLEDVAHAVKLVARETATELQETSPVGPTGEYAQSWSYGRNTTKGKSYMDMVVYSKKPHYRVTHLLEHGHLAVDGSFVSASPHIKAAEKKAGERLDIQLTKNLKG